MNDPDHVVDSSYSLSAFWPGVQFLLLAGDQLRPLQLVDLEPEGIHAPGLLRLIHL